MFFIYFLEEVVKPPSHVGLCKKNFSSIHLWAGRVILFFR